MAHLEGFEPPTLSLEAICSSSELQVQVSADEPFPLETRILTGSSSEQSPSVLPLHHFQWTVT